MMVDGRADVFFQILDFIDLTFKKICFENVSGKLRNDFFRSQEEILS